MKYRQFGRTNLQVSEVGFGAWAIGGASMVGNTPIGWGKTHDQDSIKALQTAFNQGVNFFDTADFYGLGHLEKLIGKVFSSNKEVIIATKVGHRIDDQNKIYTDYSKNHIIRACEGSLQRLQRETIDYYQLHTANVIHLEKGECLEALNLLKEQGKIRYWGISLNTYDPYPEAFYMINRQLGDGFQLVFNIINQAATSIIQHAGLNGYGIIARMPLQFGLLTGKFQKDSQFAKDDHRNMRLKPLVLHKLLKILEDVWPLSENNNISNAQLALSFILSHPQISTVIPGIKSADQAKENTQGIVTLAEDELDMLHTKYALDFEEILGFMQKNE